MANQHFVPASYIGRFSLDQSGPWRKRTVWVQRVGRDPYPASAEYVGYSRRLYDPEVPGAEEKIWLDSSWTYESRLPAALDALEDRSAVLDGRLWAQVLVPFFSSLFIRGLDFISRFQSRLPGITGPPTDDSEPLFESCHDNTIMARQIEWQRLLAPVMTANWTVVHGSGAPVLITSDVAHCLMAKYGQPQEHIAYAFPLSPSSVLVLERRTMRWILDWDGQRWTAPVQHRDAADDDLANCRRAIQHGALAEVYGPTRETVTFPSADFVPATPAVGPSLLYPHPRTRTLLPYLEDYFRVLTLLEQSPMEFYAKEEHIDWDVVAQSWHNIVQVFVDMPHFPGGTAITPFACYLDLARFSIEDVEKTYGKRSEDMDPVPTDLRPELRRLIEMDLKEKGMEHLLDPKDQPV